MATNDTTPLGTVQTTLAVGSIKQINNLKKSKNLLNCKTFSRLPFDMYPLHTNHVSFNQQSPTDKNLKCSTNTLKPTLPQFINGNSNLATMFGNFIETLAAKLPERNANTQSILSQSNSSFPAPGKCMRPTSELLDELQRALAVTPTSTQKNAIPHTITQSRNQQTEFEQKFYRVHIEIESALHLPSIAAVFVNKKKTKRQRNSIDSGRKRNPNDIQPNTYATFEAFGQPTDMSTSYATNIVENSCDPQWNKHFEVYLPIEFLHNVSLLPFL